MAEAQEAALAEEYEEESSDASDTGDEAVYDEEEPKLKYDRIKNNLLQILEQDAASCIAVHSKFLALGTHWGSIHILDHQGNDITGKRLVAHSTTVNDLSIDENGDHVASASDDGRVVISGLYSQERNYTVQLEGSCKSMCLEPGFSKPNSKQMFAAGVSKLLLFEKGYFGRRKSEVIHEGEGTIRCVKWRGDLIAWSNDTGVKVYDVTAKRRIVFIAKDHDESLRSELYPCRLHWKDRRTLFIAWANTVKICIVNERKAETAQQLPTRYMEMVAIFTMDCYIAGIAPLNDDLVLLTCNMDNDEEETSRPNMRIITPGLDTYTEQSNDALSVKEFQSYTCKDYSLGFMDEEQLFYVVSPKDIIVAKPRDVNDHVEWLLEGHRYEEALLTVSRDPTAKASVQEIGEEYLEYLMATEQYDEAGRLCQRILKNSREAWEKKVYMFAKVNQLTAVAPYIPTGDPTLSPAIYEMILSTFLTTDQEVFKEKLHEWPSTLYSTSTLIKAVFDRLNLDQDNVTLLQSLADLYLVDKKYDKALELYLRIRAKGVFELIHRHNLFSAVSDKILLLMHFDQERAVELFLSHIEQIPVEMIVEQLDSPGHEKLLHTYLDKLFVHDPQAGQDFHGRQVELYAEYEPNKLLHFLRSSSHYPLQRALEICKHRKYFAEMVYLLGRMGSTQQALQLITSQLKDVCQAIDFCKEHNEKELWQQLIDSSVHNPEFVKGLLNNVGTHIDPILVIERIEEGMNIPGLRDALVKILHDYNLQISLRKGCQSIMANDVYQLLQRLCKASKRGVCVESTQTCTICGDRMFVTDLRMCSTVAVFSCQHIFHEDCLPLNAPACPLCNSQRRSVGEFSSSQR